MDSPEPLSCANIHARIRVILKETEHLKTRLPAGSPYNATLRLQDIVRYIGRGDGGAGWVERCQRELSLFFKGWDAGTLVKAPVNGRWEIVNRYMHHAAVSDAATRSHACQIDLSQIRPRLKINGRH